MTWVVGRRYLTEVSHKKCLKFLCNIFEVKGRTKIIEAGENATFTALDKFLVSCPRLILLKSDLETELEKYGEHFDPNETINTTNYGTDTSFVNASSRVYGANPSILNELFNHDLSNIKQKCSDKDDNDNAYLSLGSDNLTPNGSFFAQTSQAGSKKSSSIRGNRSRRLSFHPSSTVKLIPYRSDQFVGRKVQSDFGLDSDTEDKTTKWEGVVRSYNADNDEVVVAFNIPLWKEELCEELTVEKFDKVCCFVNEPNRRKYDNIQVERNYIVIILKL